MIEINQNKLIYNRVRTFYVIIGLAIASMPLQMKGFSLKLIPTLAMLMAFAWLGLLWVMYMMVYRAFKALPEAAPDLTKKLSEALFNLAFVGAAGLIVGISVGYELGTSFHR